MEEYFKRLADGPPFSVNEDKKYEFRRLISFQSWPTESPAYAIKLAKAGFFYNRNGDEVVCFKCGAKKSGWTSLDDPIIEHRVLNSDCPFLVDNGDNDNVPVLVTDTCIRNDEFTEIMNLGNRLDCLLNKDTGNTAVASQRAADNNNESNDPNVSNAAEDNENNTQNPLGDLSGDDTASLPASSPSLSDQQSIQRSRSLGNLQTNFRQSLPDNVCTDKRSSTFPDTSASRDNATNFAATASALDTTLSGVAQGQSGAEQSRGTGTKPKEDKKRDKHAKTSKDKKDKKSVKSSKTAINRDSRAGSNTGPPQAGYDIPPPSGESIGPLRFERNRLETFSTWPSSAFVPANELAKCGFFYTGSGDRVQCIFCKGILRNWEEGDRPHIEHRRHFPRCPLVLGMKIGNVPLPVNQNLSFGTFSSMTGSATQTNQMQGGNAAENVADSFNMETLGIVTDRPKNPQYAIESQRLASFRGWPQYKHQTPQQLAEAGFWYAGFNDNVKCFYCDGGLRNWEPGDVPWEEHAHWFPKCPYVLQVKGQEFINGILREKGGEMAIIANAQRSAGQLTEGSDFSGRFRVEEREVRARMDSPYIKKVLDLGVSKQSIMNTIRKRMHETGDDFPSATALMEAVFREEANEQSQNPSLTQNAPDSQTGLENPTQNDDQSQNQNKSGNNTEATSEDKKTDEENKVDDERSEPKDQATGSSGTSVQADDLMKENLELKEQRLCKICMVSDANVVFLPCGHLVSCASCAPALQMCPICRATIKGTVRTYIA